MTKPWQVLERRPLLQRSYLTLWEDRVRLPNGTEIDDFCVIDAPDWAATVCVTEARELLLVRQYRHGIRAESLELPAGALEAQETPLAGARRELLEETGHASERWQPLLTVSVDPARQSGRAHFFAALGAAEVAAQKLDESEDLTFVRVPLREVMGLLEAGRIVHGLHVAAILNAERTGLFAD